MSLTHENSDKPATEHMTMLENTPERVRKYFGDKHVAYAAS